MRRSSYAAAGLVLGAGILLSPAIMDAGLFSRKCPECAEPQPEPQKEKRPCCLFPSLPPRGATASALPAVITTQRADRTPAPSAAPVAAAAPKVAPVPAACTDGSPAAAATDPQLKQDVEILKQQIKALTILLNKAE